MASSTGGGNSRGNTAKALVSDQISQAVLSTSNLIHLMQQSSPSQGLKNEHIGVEDGSGGALLIDLCSCSYFEQYWKRLTTMLYVVIAMAQLIKLPKNLLVKTSTIKNTGQLLGQMPRVISSLDAHMENGLQSVPHLQTVIQLLENMESCQLSSLSQAHVLQEEHEVENAKVG